MSLNIIIPLIIVVLLAAIVAIMVVTGKFSSKRKKGVEDAALDDAPKQEIDYIASAEKMLEQQRFDDAILELKIGAQKSPNNNNIDLKLLSIYALVNNDFEFKTLYDRIVADSDIETIEAANEIKKEKEAELAQPLHNDGFDDDLIAPAPPVNNSTLTEDFAGDDFNFDQLSEPVDNTSEDLDWMPESNTTETAESFDFDPNDMSFPEDVADPNSVSDIPTETQSVEDLDFPTQSENALPFDMPSEDSADATPNSDNASTAMPSMDGKEMDWQFSADEPSTHDDTTDINSLEIDPSSSTDVPTQPDSQQDLGNMELEWDDGLSKPESDSLESKADTSVNDQTIDEPIEQSEFATTPSSDEFDFDTDNISDDSDLSALFSDEQGLEHTSSLDSLDDSDDKAPLEFVKQIDNVQLTLDLAEQYLEIGEYDSAKRLVKEITLGDATEAQKSRAEEILELIY